jgi:DNA topoisomerase-1
MTTAIAERTTRARRARATPYAAPSAPPALHPEGPETARAAGLRYVHDDGPGIRRRRAGRAFSYVAPDGTTVRDLATLRRIRALAIPPAWTDVWICPSANGHIQATGRDARGRKQYRYHARWSAVRDSTKYGRMLLFAEALPRIRERVARDLSRPGLAREKVLATLVSLLQTTFIRIGNEEYARENRSYGLTTLRNRHADISGSTVRFHFRGKSGVAHEVSVRDRRLAQVVKRCQELPGQELFQYVDHDGQRHAVSSCDVNAYLREITGKDFTAKDFRTWAGTLLAFLAFCECQGCESEAQAKRQVAEVVKCVAARLGNTPAVCRKCYVHPAVLESYLEPETRRTLVEYAEAASGASGELHPEERAVVEFLRSRARA